MRPGFVSLLALNATGVLAAPSSAPEVTNMDEIKELAASAYENAQEFVEAQAKRGSTCSWGNVRVRREW